MTDCRRRRGSPDSADSRAGQPLTPHGTCDLGSTASRGPLDRVPHLGDLLQVGQSRHDLLRPVAHAVSLWEGWSEGHALFRGLSRPRSGPGACAGRGSHLRDFQGLAKSRHLLTVSLLLPREAGAQCPHCGGRRGIARRICRCCFGWSMVASRPGASQAGAVAGVRLGSGWEVGASARRGASHTYGVAVRYRRRSAGTRALSCSAVQFFSHVRRWRGPRPRRGGRTPAAGRGRSAGLLRSWTGSRR